MIFFRNLGRMKERGTFRWNSLGSSSCVGMVWGLCFCAQGGCAVMPLVGWNPCSYHGTQSPQVKLGDSFTGHVYVLHAALWPSPHSNGDPASDSCSPSQNSYWTVPTASPHGCPLDWVLSGGRAFVLSFLAHSSLCHYFRYWSMKSHTIYKKEWMKSW